MRGATLWKRITSVSYTHLDVYKRQVQDFAEKLREASGLPLIYWDERLTTKSAHRTLIEADMSRKKRKAVVDKIAAVYILQGYMDSL